jgi:hypothetical protein
VVDDVDVVAARPPSYGRMVGDKRPSRSAAHAGNHVLECLLSLHLLLGIPGMHTAGVVQCSRGP